MRTERQLIDRYLKDIRDFPKLTHQEEVRYLKEYKTHRNPKAQSRLVQSNLRFVVSVAVKYQHQGLELLELINEGNLGLMEAVDKFNLEKYGSLKFISYAVWWIRASIMKALFNKSRLIRSPSHKVTKMGAVSRYVDQSLQKFGFVDYHYIARELAISPNDVVEILSLNNKRISLDAPLDGDGGKELRHMMGDESAEPPDNIVDAKFRQQAVEKLVGILNGKEKEVVRGYFGLGLHVSLNLRQVGKKLNISTERVRQIRNNAMAKMRNRSQWVLRGEIVLAAAG